MTKLTFVQRALDCVPFFGRKRQERRRKKQQAIRETYINACINVESRKRLRVESLKQSLREMSLQLLNYLQAIVGQRQSSEQTKMEMDGLAVHLSQKAKKSAAEFDDLIAIPEVNNVEFRSEGIRIITMPIDIVHNTFVYRLGQFAIDIIDNQQVRVQCIVCTGRDKAFIHPHFKKGKFTIPVHLHVPLAKLVAGLEYADVVQIVVNVLKTYDPASCLVQIENNWKGEPQ